jgi:hypothetical protein
MDTAASQRTQAVKRIEAKREFWRLLILWIGASVALVAVWVVTGDYDYFWPAWPMLAFGAAVAFAGIRAFGPGERVISEADIDAEMQKMTKRP